MKVISYQLNNLSEEEYYIKHLQIINQLLPVSITNKELEVLAAFMALDGNVVKKDRFGTTARKLIKEKLNLSDGGLGNYLKALRKKKFIHYNEFNVLEANKYLFPEQDSQGYNIKINKIENV
jgi:hypothetical protein